MRQSPLVKRRYSNTLRDPRIQSHRTASKETLTPRQLTRLSLLDNSDKSPSASLNSPTSLDDFSVLAFPAMFGSQIKPLGPWRCEGYTRRFPHYDTLGNSASDWVLRGKMGLNMYSLW